MAKTRRLRRMEADAEDDRRMAAGSGTYFEAWHGMWEAF
jgi:hypothetical protein